MTKTVTIPFNSIIEDTDANGQEIIGFSWQNGDLVVEYATEENK